MNELLWVQFKDSDLKHFTSLAEVVPYLHEQGVRRRVTLSTKSPSCIISFGFVGGNAILVYWGKRDKKRIRDLNPIEVVRLQHLLRQYQEIT